MAKRITTKLSSPKPAPSKPAAPPILTTPAAAARPAAVPTPPPVLARTTVTPSAPPAPALALASAKRKVTFSIVAPAAHAVSLAGTFTNWDRAPIQLEKEKDGVWKKTLALDPGTYEYRLLVDGQWQDDPHCDRRVPNPFGTQNCLRMVA